MTWHDIIGDAVPHDELCNGKWRLSMFYTDENGYVEALVGFFFYNGEIRNWEFVESHRFKMPDEFSLLTLVP